MPLAFLGTVGLSFSLTHPFDEPVGICGSGKQVKCLFVRIIQSYGQNGTAFLPGPANNKNLVTSIDLPKVAFCILYESIQGYTLH
jgi:hypothetical protein